MKKKILEHSNDNIQLSRMIDIVIILVRRRVSSPDAITRRRGIIALYAAHITDDDGRTHCTRGPSATTTTHAAPTRRSTTTVQRVQPGTTRAVRRESRSLVATFTNVGTPDTEVICKKQQQRRRRRGTTCIPEAPVQRLRCSWPYVPPLWHRVRPKPPPWC